MKDLIIQNFKQNILIFFYSPKPAEKAKTPAPPTEQSTTAAGSEVAPSTVDMSDRKSRMMTQQSQPGSRPTSPDRMVPLYDKDLIRMLAEVAFIQGEVIIIFAMLE